MYISPITGQNITVAEVELTYKSTIRNADLPQLRSSRDAYNVLSAYWDEDMELRETFFMLFLNRGNRITGIYRVSKGGVAGTVVDAKLIFAAALKTMASGIILAHNHPSGNPRPSAADRQITNKVVKGAEYLDIVVLDHLILTSEGYFSFADEGLL